MTLKACRGPFSGSLLRLNIVDRNFIWRTCGFGIFGGDSKNQLYEHNIIGETNAAAMLLFCHTDRVVNKKPAICIHI